MSETPSPPPSAAARAWPIALAVAVLCDAVVVVAYLTRHAATSATLKNLLIAPELWSGLFVSLLVTPVCWGGPVFLGLWGLFALWRRREKSPPA